MWDNLKRCGCSTCYLQGIASLPAILPMLNVPSRTIACSESQQQQHQQLISALAAAKQLQELSGRTGPNVLHPVLDQTILGLIATEGLQQHRQIAAVQLAAINNGVQAANFSNILKVRMQFE